MHTKDLNNEHAKVTKQYKDAPWCDFYNCIECWPSSN